MPVKNFRPLTPSTRYLGFIGYVDGSGTLVQIIN